MFLHVWRWQRATWTTRGELPVWFVIRLARHRVVVGHFAVCGRVSVLCSMMGPTAGFQHAITDHHAPAAAFSDDSIFGRIMTGK